MGARAVLLLSLALSVWVAINGAVFAQQNLDVCAQNFYALEFACWLACISRGRWWPRHSLARSRTARRI
jgi:hypothetical protein